MALDPIFANILNPFRFPPAADAHMRKLLDCPQFIAEDIAGLEEDIRACEQTIAQNEREIPEMQQQTLICQRDAAVAKLKIIALKAKLNAQMGGAA